MPNDYSLQNALDNHTRLHALRFASIRKESFFVAIDFQLFHRTFCHTCDQSELQPIFTECLHNDRVVGSLYGVRNAVNFVFLMTGFDPEYATLSIGNLLIYETARHLIDAGVNAFDFKVGDEPYKKKWTRTEYTKFDMSIRLTRTGVLMALPKSGRQLKLRIMNTIKNRTVNAKSH